MEPSRFRRMNTLDIKVTRSWTEGYNNFQSFDTSEEEEDEGKSSRSCFSFKSFGKKKYRKSKGEGRKKEGSKSKAIDIQQKVPGVPPTTTTTTTTPSSVVKMPRVKTLTAPPLGLHSSSSFSDIRPRARSVNSRISASDVFNNNIIPPQNRGGWNLYPDFESLGYESDRWSKNNDWEGDYSSITCGDSHSEGGDSGCSGGSSSQGSNNKY